MKVVRYIGSVFLVASLFGCASNGIEVKDKAPDGDKAEFTSYEIGVGDVLTINVWRNPELSLTTPVRPDGNISLPLVGDVQAANTTASSLSSTLRKKLENYIRNPQVTVILSESLSSDYQQRVRVTGAVENPLSLAYRDGMTVLDVVLEAGGLNEFALANKAILYRNTPTGVSAYKIKLNDIFKRGRLETNYELHPSDIITVPERVF